MATRILLIDDDERLGPLLASYFERFDLALDHAVEPLSGLEMAATGGYALVILDVMLPGLDGFEVCRRIRRESRVPILMLTARGDVTDRIVGMEIGADDYLPKPFEPRELVVRIQSILRRVGPEVDTQRLDFGDLVIDRSRREVLVERRPVELTSREYALLEYLATRPGRACSRDEIISAMRGHDVELLSRSVDIAVSRLRSKLRPSDHIRTVWGAGYAFVG